MKRKKLEILPTCLRLRCITMIDNHRGREGRGLRWFLADHVSCFFLALSALDLEAVRVTGAQEVSGGA